MACLSMEGGRGLVRGLEVKNEVPFPLVGYGRLGFDTLPIERLTF